MTGGIPAEIGELTALEYLDLGSNDLTSGIPAEIGELTALEYLDLSWNDLIGKIPAEIGELTALEYLDLSLNDLRGKIPAEIGELTALEYLDLSLNDLRGKIPAEIGELTALEYLDLNWNDLTGQIPAEIGELTALEYLDLSLNDLTGQIPATFSNLVNLATLLLYNFGSNICIPSELLSWYNGIGETDSFSLRECASGPTSAESGDELPAELTLMGNYPNPFNPTTTIGFGLPTPADVRIDVYDMTGRQLSTLANGIYPSGYHTVQWDAIGLPTGIYVYRLTTGGKTIARTMTLVR